MRVVYTKLGVKKLRHVLSFLLLLLVGTNLTSCGESAPVDDSISKNQDFQINCEINEDNLDLFFEKEVPEDIKCLQKYLNLFITFVTPDKAESVGSLSQSALSKYIASREPKLLPIVKYLPLFFNTSHLIFGDEIGYLSQKNVDLLTKAAININKELAAVHPILNNKPKEELIKIHTKKSDILRQASVSIANSLEGLFQVAPDNEKPLSILDTINIFSTDENELTLKKIRSLTFLKRVFAGGDFNTVTRVELRQIIGLIPKMVKIGFDLFQFKALIFENEFQRYKFYHDAVLTLEESLYFKGQSNAKLFEIADLEKALINFEEDFGISDIKSFFGIIPEVKAIFANNPEVVFLRSDIDKLLFHAKEIIKIGEAFVDTYYAKNKVTSNKSILESNNKVTEDLLIHNPAYKEQFSDFVRIAKNYRFFRGSNPIPFYGDYYSRNLNGMIELALIEYLFIQISGYYEKNYPCRDNIFIRLRPYADPKKCTKNNQGQCIEDLRCDNGEDNQNTLSQGQIELIVVKLSDALAKLDLVTKQMEYSTAETIMLMNDLFQFQSNGNSLIDKYEIAEFGGQIISAITMKDNIVNAITQMCKNEIDELDGHTIYGANCFRENFLNVLYEKFELKSKRPGDLSATFQYSEYLPSLINYLDTPSTPLTTFVHKMEQFTNSCYGYFNAPANETAAPMDDFLYEADIMSVYGGLFNIESTLTRFDTNPVDNYLIGSEIEVTFQHFKTAVMALLEDAIEGKFQSTIAWAIDKIGPEDIARKIFYYMLKYRELPNVSSLDKAWKLGKFLADGNFRDGVVVDRITMAAVLSGIKASSKNKPTNYQRSFICNKKPLPEPVVKAKKSKK